MDLKRAVGLMVATAVISFAVIGTDAWANGPSHGVPISRCTARQGTIVAVDFAPWRGPIVRGCALHQPSGFALLHAAGFTTAGDTHDGPGFVCRLADARFRRGMSFPTDAQQSCTATPSASAYWSVWLAPSGATSWHYSQLGVMNDVPKAGEVELWTYGATDLSGTQGSGVPAFAPARLRAGHTGPAGRTAGGREVRLVDAIPTATHASSGSPDGLIAGICVVLALCAAAGVAGRRRRRET